MNLMTLKEKLEVNSKTSTFFFIIIELGDYMKNHYGDGTCYYNGVFECNGCGECNKKEENNDE